MYTEFPHFHFNFQWKFEKVKNTSIHVLRFLVGWVPGPHSTKNLKIKIILTFSFSH